MTRFARLMGFAALALLVLWSALPAKAQFYIPPVTCPGGQAMTAYSPTAGITCSANAAPNYSLGSGFVNELRNSSLSQFYSGTSQTLTSGGVWTAEGVYCLASGANGSSFFANGTVNGPNALQLIGATSNTGVTCRFVLEAQAAAGLAGARVTFQITYTNVTGATLTPQISTKYPTAPDNWTSSTGDLGATNLQSCASGALCTAAYTFNVSASATTGYEVVIAFGAFTTNAKYVVIQEGFDLRLAPGVSTGLNASPAAPEIRTAQDDAAWNKRFYECSYANGTAPGAATHNNLVGGFVSLASNFDAVGFIPYTVVKRAVPTFSYWDGAGNASKVSTTTANGGTSFSDNLPPLGAPFNGGTNGTMFLGYAGGTSVSWVHFCADARIAGN